MTAVESNRPGLGIACMLGACFFFSLMQAAAKAATTRLPPMEALFARSSVMFLLVLPTLVVTNQSILGHNRVGVFGRSVSGFIALMCSFFAISRLKLADATLLNQTSVFFVPPLAALALGERLTMRTAGLIGVAFLGCLLVIKPQLEFANIAALVGLGSGFFSAVSYVTMRSVLRTDGEATVVGNFGLVACIGALIVGGYSFLMPEGWEWLILFGVGLTGTLGQLLLTRAIRLAPASTVTPFIFSIILFSLIWGTIFWSEHPDILSAIGTLITVAAGVALTRERPRRSECG